LAVGFVEEDEHGADGVGFRALAEEIEETAQVKA
jgi:hypothetical protein